MALNTFAAPEAAHAGRDWWWAKTRGGKSGHNWAFGLDVGLRYVTHYNRELTLFTPPTTILAEVQLTAWYRRNFGIYAVYGPSVAQAASTIYGGGIKLPFLSMQSPVKSFIAGISMQLMIDGVHFATAPPTGTQLYTQSAFVFRYGGSILWAINGTGITLNTNIMVNRFSGTFIVGPCASFGYTF